MSKQSANKNTVLTARHTRPVTSSTPQLPSRTPEADRNFCDLISLAARLPENQLANMAELARCFARLNGRQDAR